MDLKCKKRICFVAALCGAPIGWPVGIFVSTTGMSTIFWWMLFVLLSTIVAGILFRYFTFLAAFSFQVTSLFSWLYTVSIWYEDHGKPQSEYFEESLPSVLFLLSFSVLMSSASCLINWGIRNLNLRPQRRNME